MTGAAKRLGRACGAIGLLLLALAAPACGQSSPQRGEFVASSRGQVYYWVGCSAWQSLSRANLRWFGSAEEAEEAGYRPSRTPGCREPAVWRNAEPGATHATSDETCTVERVIDGDTIACREGGERIRLLLVDAPELTQGTYGAAARAALLDLLPPGTIARVELDVRERDRYGRVLAYLYTPDGRMVNEVLAREGFVLVEVYPPNVRHVERLRAAAAEARRERRGLWEGSAFECSPANFRRGECR